MEVFRMLLIFGPCDLRVLPAQRFCDFSGDPGPKEIHALNARFSWIWRISDQRRNWFYRSWLEARHRTAHTVRVGVCGAHTCCDKKKGSFDGFSTSVAASAFRFHFLKVALLRYNSPTWNGFGMVWKWFSVFYNIKFLKVVIIIYHKICHFNHFKTAVQQHSLHSQCCVTLTTVYF